MIDAPSSLDALLAAVGRAGQLTLTEMLAEVLRAASGERAAAVWSRSADGWLHCVAGTGDRLAGPDRVPAADALQALPDVALVVPVIDGELDRGALTFCHLPGREPVSASQQAHARDAARYIALLLRRPQLRAELRRRIEEASRLSEALAASHERLSFAADIESRRMVADIISFGGEDLADLRERVRRMQDDRLSGTTAGSREAAQTALVELRQVLDGLIDRLRTVVRDIYPHVLHDRGLHAALAELAARLPRPVRLGGDVRGVPREVESGLYWPAAAVLEALGAAPAGRHAAPVTVTLSADDEHASVTVLDPATTSTLSAILPMAQDRLTALGGWLDHRHDDGLAVRMTLPAQLAPTVPATIATGLRPPAGPATASAEADLRGRVQRLIQAAVAVVDPDDRQDLQRALGWLDQPHIAGQPAPLSGVPEALAVLEEVTRHDRQGWLRYEYERLRADAHDLDEVTLLQALRSGSVALPTQETHAALRLLGANGSTVWARLGLTEGAGAAEIRAAAAAQVAAWRGYAESGAVGARERAAGRLLARSAEGLLMRADGGSR